jgi:hypothetical protein
MNNSIRKKMKHRHPGPKVRYHTKRNNIRFRKRPMHNLTNKVMKPDRDKTYRYLRKKYGILPTGDDDKDGVINKKDCRPWDKSRQGIFGEYDSDRLDNPEENILHPSSLTEEQAGRYGQCHKKAEEWAKENKGKLLRSETGEHSIAIKDGMVYDYVLGYDGDISLNKYLRKVPHEFSEVEDYGEEGDKNE